MFLLRVWLRYVTLNHEKSHGVTTIKQWLTAYVTKSCRRTHSPSTPQCHMLARRRVSDCGLSNRAAYFVFFPLAAFFFATFAFAMRPQVWNLLKLFTVSPTNQSSLRLVARLRRVCL